MTATEAPPAPRALAKLVLIALVIGAIDGLVFLGFEWVVNHGSDWLWNDLVNSDEVRWRVIPLAIVGSLVFSIILRLVREPRWVEPHLDPLGAADGPEDEDPPTPKLSGLAVILLVGASSLIAGASLGPEAPLVAVSMGLGAWVGSRAGTSEAAKVLILASVGALLVAFFGSLVALAIPLLVMWQRTKRLPLPAVLAVLVAGGAAWGMLWLIHGNDDGFGRVPEATVNARDYAAAILLGVLAVFVGLLLRRFVVRLAVVTKRLDGGTAWWLAALAFGAVVGVLYLIGGQTVQFSGSEGAGLLIGRADEYSGWAILGIVLVKLLVTSWCLASGYRGGLVFPSVFAGVALALAVAAAFPDLAGPGIMVGGIVGLLTEMTAPILAIVVLFALLPVKLLPLGIAATIGAVVGRKLLERVIPSSAAPAGRPTE
jgi:H+/Cl- antiporter ClcA